jgi:hypothetical protein
MRHEICHNDAKNNYLIVRLGYFDRRLLHHHLPGGRRAGAATIAGGAGMVVTSPVEIGLITSSGWRAGHFLKCFSREPNDFKVLKKLRWISKFECEFRMRISKLQRS